MPAPLTSDEFKAAMKMLSIQERHLVRLQAQRHSLDLQIAAQRCLIEEAQNDYQYDMATVELNKALREFAPLDGRIQTTRLWIMERRRLLKFKTLEVVIA